MATYMPTHVDQHVSRHRSEVDQWWRHNSEAPTWPRARVVSIESQDMMVDLGLLVEREYGSARVRLDTSEAEIGREE